MYARISRAKIKPESRAEVKALLAKLRQDSPQLPGIRYWMNFITAAHELFVIGVYASEADRAATVPINNERWASVRHLIAEEPIIVDAELTEFLAA
jgi:quinol monooxygenase YgiN